MGNTEVDGLAEAIDLLARLHRAKDRAYGDAWRKRGEVLGIFANIARKYDRLEIGFAESDASATETLGDTAGDLCVYAGKYLTWLAETAPGSFEESPASASSSACSADRGPASLEGVLHELPAWERATSQGPPSDVTEAWGRIRKAFEPLEAGLMAQAGVEGASRGQLGWNEKIELAWALCDASAWLLIRLAKRDRVHLDSIRRDVERMEASAGP